MLPQKLNLNVIERKFKRQMLMPDPIILSLNSDINLKVLVVSRHFQQRDSSSRGLLHDCEIFVRSSTFLRVCGKCAGVSTAVHGGRSAPLNEEAHH